MGPALRASGNTHAVRAAERAARFRPRVIDSYIDAATHWERLGRIVNGIEAAQPVAATAGVRQGTRQACRAIGHCMRISI